MMNSSKLVDALMLLLQLLAISCQVGAVTAAAQHRQTRHTRSGGSEDGSGDIADGTSEYAPNANDVWIAASSPPIAEATSAPMPTDDVITIDAAAIGSMITDQSDMEGKEATQSESTAAPIYALRHGRGIFAITGGTGCYKGARGQAQARFSIQSSRVDLFVPSISWTFDDIDDIGIGPQDTSWTRANSDGRRLNESEGIVEDANRHHFDRRVKSPQAGCNLFREGEDSFNIISLNLEWRFNPSGSKHLMDSSSTYHEHGEFQAQEEWFAGISGEYSLSCVHHECKLVFYFGIGPSTKGFFSTTRDRRELLADDNDKDQMTSLYLQGTTELAYQGPDTDMLVCIENCEVEGSAYKAQAELLVGLDAEHNEAINLRTFDNADSLVQLYSHGKGKGYSAKGTKGSKGKKWQFILVFRVSCLSNLFSIFLTILLLFRITYSQTL